MIKRLAAVVVVAFATLCFAQHHELSEAAPAAHSAHGIEAPTYSHPTIPEQATWAFPVMMLIAVLFVSAACIGWYVRMEMPEELPATHSHDEPPGDSHHHGHGGTINPAPDHAPDHHA